MTADPLRPGSASNDDATHSHADDAHDAHGEEEMVCYCFHVPLHKIVNFIRRERPAKVSMISHCLGAGTGCGTCVWDIKDIWKKVMAECAAEDARNGVVHAPTPAPAPPPPLPNTGLASDYFRRHSPTSVDLAAVLAPQRIPNPPLLPVPGIPTGIAVPLTPAVPSPTDRQDTGVPGTRNTPAAPPPMPVSAESADIDLDFEPEPEATPPPAPAKMTPPPEDPRP